MTPSEYERSIAEDDPPSGLTPALVALWWLRRGDWNAAHQIVMDAPDRDSAWVHAHLHRAEGDLDNAGYWYRQARRPVQSGPLADEWRAIVTALIGEGPKQP